MNYKNIEKKKGIVKTGVAIRILFMAVLAVVNAFILLESSSRLAESIGDGGWFFVFLAEVSFVALILVLLVLNNCMGVASSLWNFKWIGGMKPVRREEFSGRAIWEACHGLMINDRLPVKLWRIAIHTGYSEDELVEILMDESEKRDGGIVAFSTDASTGEVSVSLMEWKETFHICPDCMGVKEMESKS